MRLFALYMSLGILPSTQAAYQVLDNYTGENFFNMFEFYAVRLSTTFTLLIPHTNSPNLTSQPPLVSRRRPRQRDLRLQNNSHESRTTHSLPGRHRGYIRRRLGEHSDVTGPQERTAGKSA